MKYLVALLLTFLFTLALKAQEIKLMLPEPEGHIQFIDYAEFSPDGNFLLTTSFYGDAVVRDVQTGKKLYDFSIGPWQTKIAHFSKDGTKIITCFNNSVNIWNTKTGELAKKYSFPADIKDAEFSPNSKMFVCTLNDSLILITNLENDSIVDSIKETTLVESVKFCQDGKKIFSFSDLYGTCKIWDSESGKLISDFNDLGNQLERFKFPTCELSPDGEKIVVGAYTGEIMVWDIGLRKPILNLVGHKYDINYIKYSPDGKLIITVSADRTAIIWDANTGKQLKILGGNNNMIKYAEFNYQNSKIFTASENGSMLLWERKNNTWESDSIKGNLDTVKMAIFSPNTEKFATVSVRGTLNIWGTRPLKLLAECKGLSKLISSVYKYDNNKIAVVFYDYCEFWNIETGKLINRISLPAGNILIDFNSSHDRFITYSYESILPYIRVDRNYITVRLWNANTFKMISELSNEQKVTSLNFSNAGDRLITTSSNGTTIIWNTKTGAKLFTLEKHKPDIWYADFNENDTKILTNYDDGTVKIWESSTGKLIKPLISGYGHNCHFFVSPDNSKIVTVFDDNCIKIWDSIGSPSCTINQHKNYVFVATFCNDNKWILTSSDSLTIINDCKTGREIFRVPMERISKAELLPDGKSLIAYYDTVVKVWDINTNKFKYCLNGIGSSVKDLQFNQSGTSIITYLSNDSVLFWDINNGKYIYGRKSTFENYCFCHPDKRIYYNDLIIMADNDELKFFNYKSGELLYKLILIDSTNWVVLHQNGLFDASQGAMEKMYWVKGDEVIDFNQLKDRYWQPGLWKMIMDGKPLRSVEGMNQLKLQPEVEVGEVKNGILPITLTKRDGGYGKVSITVNNKEVTDDARPAHFDTSKQVQTITYNIKKYLLPGKENNIEVKAKSADGFVSSRGIPTTFTDETKTITQKPAFYAVVCGTGEFSNPSIHLKYPVPDADAIAKAITIGANNLFGKDSTHVTVLTSPGNLATTKKNIQATFAAIKATAKPEDVVLVYLSGHGIDYGGDNGDFYYLTTDASGTSAESFADPILRKQQAISTDEFTHWLNEIPALKNVMIIDACGSGKAVDNLIAKRDIDASQIKAIDRMKDRTGLFIISGCAADAVSFEASRYGQGLLTYSLLQAMKGAKLTENNKVDVETLLNYARDEVPKMAEGIGGIQQPQLLIPKGGSFDIGIIREEDKALIPLAQLKPVFVRTNLQEETKHRDILRIGHAIDDKLNEVSARGDAKSKIVFIDADDYPDACSISGGYTINGDKISFTGSLLCGTKEKTIKFDNLTKDELVNKLVDVAVGGL